MATAVLISAVVAAPASGATGVFDRTWGKDVDSALAGNGPEICTVAINCQPGSNATALGGEMSNPAGVATDAAGNVYVADQGRLRVQKFDSQGNFERAWGRDVVASGPGNTMSGFFEICVAANGDVCKAGSGGGPAGEFNLPIRIATGPGGKVYVVDFVDQVLKFDSDGNFERKWGKNVILSGPNDSGSGAFEICVAGVDVCQTGTDGVLGGEMSNPSGVGTDASGNVYVGDSNNDRVQKFSSLGVFERAWGKDVVSTGPGDTMSGGFEICVAADSDVCKAGSTTTAAGGELNSPESVASDSAGRIYVADGSNHRIQRFDSSGNFQRAWGKDVAAGGPGNTGTAFEICSSGADICKIGVAASAGGEFSGLNGVGADSAGNVYTTESGNDRVQRFTTAGEFQRAWGKDVIMSGPNDTGTDAFEICVAGVDTCKGADASTGLGGEMGNPASVAADAAGDVYVADTQNHRIQKFTDLPPPATPSPTPTPPAAVPTTTDNSKCEALKAQLTALLRQQLKKAKSKKKKRKIRRQIAALRC
jgi:sugar lactone lactonase YvrE